MDARAAPTDVTLVERVRSALRAARLRLVGAALDPTERAAFDEDVAAANARRLGVLLPLMTVGHAIHVALFWTSPDARSSLTDAVVRWRELLVAVHAATGLVAFVLAAVTLRSRGRAPYRWLGAAAASLYVLHAAAIVGVDQITLTSVTPFVGYCLGVAIVVTLPPRVSGLVFATGLAAFVVALSTTQASSSARLASIPNGVTSAAVGAVLSILLYAARRRDFSQRATIDRQRTELVELNQGLERRVAEQVREIVAHAEEVERLNGELSLQVRERSVELSRALAKLTARREIDGTLREGALLGDRFEIGALLGSGGMGAVYAGTDRSNGGRVAIKVIQAASSSQLDAIHRFLREAGTAAAVTHPAIVRMLHVDVSDDGLFFQVQELVPGEALDRRLRRGRPWDPLSAARLVSVLCDALAAAHARGIVHRDVKPANVMLMPSPPGLKLLDFGISKLYEQSGESDGATQTGVILGTPAFMGPEQLTGATEISDRTDVYAVGIVLYLLLTGGYPFPETSSPLRMVVDHVSLVAPDARSRVPTIPAELAELVARCLEKAPDDRPSAAEVRDALAAFADAEDRRTLDALERAGILFPGPAPVAGVTLAGAALADTRRAG